MEVVMGRCFPLTGPGHHLAVDFTVKGAVQEGEKAPDSLVSKNVNGKDNYCTARSPGGEVAGLAQHDHGKMLAPQRLGAPHHPKQTAMGGPDQRSSGKENELSHTKTKEDKREGQSSEKPKMQSILRRTCSSSASEERDSGESPKAPTGRGEQNQGSERELSWGKRAWEMTQRRKAQMREEFFKVPYEECNKEAAQSLGGRLNKSEPRLHTLGKDRKKRNSLSYKRRVHFDLDHGEEEDRKPRSRSKSFEAPDPPRKVVVSIYSIDKPKSVIQPDAFYCSAPDGAAQGARDTASARARSARPTDLDSLQQKAQTDAFQRQQSPGSTEQPDSQQDRRTRFEPNQRLTPSPSPSPSPTTPQSLSGATTPGMNSAVVKSGSLTTPTPKESCSTPLRPPRTQHALPSPLQSVANNPATSCSQPLPCNTSPAPPDQPASVPVPAPRSHLAKSHSLPSHTRSFPTSLSREAQQASSQLSRPRPDHLDLNSSSARGAVHTFTPTKAFIQPHTATPAHTHFTTPRTFLPPPTHVPTPSTPATTLTPASSTAPNTPTMPFTITTTPTPIASRAPGMSTHTTPQTPTQLPNLLGGPVPMPRKRISVSQQTPTPNTSPLHRLHTPTAPPTQTTRHNRDTHTVKKAPPTKMTVPPQDHDKENDSARQNQKTDVVDRENSINILMTKGESYAKHNIVISSHKSSAPPPSVTVRKVFIPVSTPSRSSPSPTPSCASSSCSFGSSGSSSGCYSGSPSPTPTPSPTRIRASCAPTDL
ncbi:LOW QUALITY PROTEIN: serine/arginine repetitive matrix protein 1-like [Portunus trituberculatus]|uniref:LOW QUALITY PROTEIN: serine/arginine repetitive matrix protein 1-like n=1 Tax=Portunus trituberculatus TaxID=210409 RepID=UPI001E1CF2AF|nr:LOW QUALITY PROTEIN: serine/arginine repetitive matrix protein 1-like [Portunus trituberculatus]